MARDQIQVEGLRELQREIRRTGDRELRKEMRQANKDAAEPVAQRARTIAPRRSGRLAASVKNASTNSGGRVKAGTPARVPYAGVIHFGWPRRNIRPQPFLYDALDARQDEVREAYEKAMRRLADHLSSR